MKPRMATSLLSLNKTAMNKQNLYVAFFNSLLGVVVSLLLKGNLLIYALTFLIVLTILYIERTWIYEKIFRKKKWQAILGYAVMVAAMLGFLMLITEPSRDSTLIVNATHQFLDHVQPGKYEQAYQALTSTSQHNYSESNFINDHEDLRIKVQDFRIDEIVFNEFDKKRAVVKVSSAFSIYGQNSTSLEVVKENGVWKVSFSPTMIDRNTPLNGKNLELVPAESEEKSKPGWLRRFFRKVF